MRYGDWPATVRPKHIAERLGIDARRLRAWLRHIYPRPEYEKGAPWEFTPAKADEIVRRWLAEHV